MNSSWTKNISIRPEAVNLQKANIREKLLDVGLCQWIWHQKHGQLNKNRLVGLH